MKGKLTAEIFLNFVTSVGASIVILGALFKITHMNGADTMLTIGLVTESIIFLVYAFTPPVQKNKYPVTETMYKLKPEMANSGAELTNSKLSIPHGINENLNEFNENLIALNKKYKDLLKVFNN